MERVEIVPGIDRSEAEALAYFAMGVASEGSINGRNVAYQLSFAGTISNTGKMSPIGSSGFSIGTLQTDLGKHPTVAGDLTAAYRVWSAQQHTPQPISAQDDAGWAELERMLARDGHAIRREQGQGLPAATFEGINAFLASDRGIDFIHDRDMAQVDRLLRADTAHARSALHSIGNTSVYRDASDDDRIRLAAVFLKLENQSGSGIYPRLIRRINEGELDSLAAIKATIDARRDYVSTGAKHTLAGVEAYLAVRRLPPESPMTEAGLKVLRSPLVRPTSLTGEGDPSSPNVAEYHAVKTMFVQPDATVPFLQAMATGSGFTYGRSAPRQTGFFVSGRDFVYWDGDGRGHASIGTAWRQVARDEIRRVDLGSGRVDLMQRTAHGEEALLRIDRTIQPLRPAPEAMIDTSLRARVRELHSALGTSDSHPDIDRITASLMQANSALGMRHVQHIAANNGRLLAWDGDPMDPATRWSSISLDDARKTPVETSLQALPSHETRDPDIQAPGQRNLHQLS